MTDPVPLSSTMRFLTLADAAEVLNLSVHEVSGLVQSGELTALRMGKNGPWRIEDSALEGFIAARYEEAQREARWNQADFSNVTELAFGVD